MLALSRVNTLVSAKAQPARAEPHPSKTMKTRRPYEPIGLHATYVMALLVLSCALPASLQSQPHNRNPAGKVYFADVSGEAQIQTGETVKNVSSRSVYTAEGAIIETRRPSDVTDTRKTFSTIVYSNGSAAFVDADSRIEVKRFLQEPFTPNRTDVDQEPSASQTQTFISRGTVALCNSRLLAGSIMTYQTTHGSVNIRGRKVVIETTSEETRISVLEGASTVRAGPMDLGGHTVRAGEQAVIRPSEPGQANVIQIIPIPPSVAPSLDEMASMACMAKRTVYFEVRERPEGDPNEPAGSEPTLEGGSPGLVTAFDGNSAGAPGPDPIREIVVVPLVPTELPVEYTISPATLATP